MYVFQPRSAEDLLDLAVLGRDRAAGVREPARRLGDAGHAVARVVAPGQQARARRRAQRRRVPLRVAHAVAGDPVDVRRLDRAAVARHRREADVVEHGVHHVRRPLGRLRRLERRPIRHRVPDVDVDLALERLGHGCSSSSRPPSQRDAPRRRITPMLAPSGGGWHRPFWMKRGRLCREGRTACFQTPPPAKLHAATRATQRKPMWLVELSTSSDWRAAGR